MRRVGSRTVDSSPLFASTAGSMASRLPLRPARLELKIIRMKIHELVERCADAAEGRDPMNAVRKVLEGLRGDLADLDRSLAFISGVGGNARQVFFRSPKLFMLKARFPAGRRTPPHNHGTWATILLLSGKEKNTLYLRDKK